MTLSRITLLPCSFRDHDDRGRWRSCPTLPTRVDPDGDALCHEHMEFLWRCPDCGAFILEGDNRPCRNCSPATDAERAADRKRIQGMEDAEWTALTSAEKEARLDAFIAERQAEDKQRWQDNDTEAGPAD